MKFILLLLISLSAFGQNAAIFNGDGVKILKEKLKFKTEKSIESGTIDPAAIATAGDLGSLYLRDNGILYVKQDNGTTTNWEAVVDENTAQTLTNKTLTSPVLNTSVSGTAILDEDNMASDSNTQLATQQSIKAYADGVVSGSMQSGIVDPAAVPNFIGETYVNTVTEEVFTAVGTAAVADWVASKFLDTKFNIFDNGDITKRVFFQLAGLTTSTDRTLTVADHSGTIIAGNSPDIVWDNANARLGLGVAGPTVELDIVGDTLLTGDGITVGSQTVDNLNLNGNTIISTDVNGNIVNTPNGTGRNVISKEIEVQGPISTGITTDAASTGANVTLTLPTTDIVRLTNASLTSIDMITAPTRAQKILLINQTGVSVVLNDATGATPANQILTGSGFNVTMLDQASVTLVYDTTETKWMMLGLSGDNSGVPLMAKGSLFASNGTFNGEFTACADGEIIEWDALEATGFKCVVKPSLIIPALNYQLSASSGVFTTNSLTYVDVTNLSVTITTTGGPVSLKLVHDGTGGRVEITETGTGSGRVIMLRGATTLTDTGLYNSPNNPIFGSFHVVDVPAAGTYTYKIQALNTVGGGFANTAIAKVKLFAHELQ